MATRPIKNISPEPELAAIVDGVLRLELSVTDPECVADASWSGSDPDPVSRAKERYRLGVVVGRTSSLDASVADARALAERLERLERAPERLAREAESALNKAVKAALGENGLLSHAVSRELSRGAATLSQALQPVVDRLTGAAPDAVPQVLAARIQAETDAALKRALDSLLGDDGALHKELAQHGATIEQIRRAVSEMLTPLIAELARADTPTDPVADGRSFEQRTLDELAGFAMVLGDELRYTGQEPGHGRSKAGDGLLVCDDQPSVCVECRTGARRFTVGALRQAAENRDAPAALLITAEARALPRDAEQHGFHIYRGARVVVLHHDPEHPAAGQLLAAALQIARMLALTARDSNGVDRDRVGVALDAIERTMTRMRSAKGSAGAIIREAEKLRGGFAEMESDLVLASCELMTLVSAR